MTMQTEFERRLDGVAVASLPTTLVVDDQRDQVQVTLLELDAVGCAFESLTYRTSRLDRLGKAQLRKLGAELADRITYLLEPIRPVEIDEEVATLQLRSNRPQQSDDCKRYYEVLVQSGTITLSRYEKTPKQSRGQIPAHVTREVLARLICDFEAASHE